MFTYLALNLVFIAGAVLGSLPDIRSLVTRPRLIGFGILCGLTLIFDNLIIATGIVAYDDSLILGVKLGLAPLEDFFYPLAALIVLPYVWRKLRSKS